MSSANLTITLVGSDADRGYVHFESFIRFCDSVQKCLRTSEAIISGEAAKIEYRITALECGSAMIRLQPVRRRKQVDHKQGKRPPVDEGRVIDFFRKTVADIERGKVDPRMSPDQLETFRELSEPLKKDAKRVKIGRVAITNRFDRTIAKLLEESISSEGSVQGKLERINVHDRHEFFLYTETPGDSVTCSFPPEMLDKVRDAIKRYVTVFGTRFFRPGSHAPSRVHVKEMEIHPDDSELPTLQEIRALGKWDTGRMGAVEFLRSIRDE